MIVCIMTMGICHAQSKISGIITGNAIDTTTGKGIPFVNIEMTRLADTSVKYRSSADDKGAFELQDIKFGHYVIEFSAVGYARIRIDSIHFREERFDFNLGDIKMFPSATDLEAVIVYSEKPLVESRDGMIIYNIGESALSANSSTSEILKTMPLISNDADGNLLLKGREPRILIDGKPTNLNSQQLNDLLESLPGGLIDRVELMTNPPSEYASEDGGVINIVTKKGKVGWTGRVTTYFGTLGDANLSSNISYRDKKWIVQITAGAGYNRVKGENGSKRETFYKDSSNFLMTRSVFNNRNIRPNLRLSADYELNKYQLFNATLLLNMTDIDNFSSTDYRNLNRHGEVYKFSTRTNATEGNTFTPTVNFNYRWRKKSNTRENLNLFTSFVLGNTQNTREYYQQFKFNDGTPTGIDSAQRQQTDNHLFNIQLRANYNKPLSKRILLSGGITFINNSTHNQLNTDVLPTGGSDYLRVDSISPVFGFYQQIYTLRFGTTIDLPRLWRIMPGIQAENTGFRFDFSSGGNNSSENYLNFLPNFTLRKEWRNSGYSSSLVYRKTIRRPTLAQLNPSVDYSNPYSIRFGNTALTPQLADNFDWNFGYFKSKFNVNVSVGYNFVKDIIQVVRTLVPGDKTQITFNNITDRRELETTIWAAYTLNRKIRTNFGAGYNYNYYSEYDKEVNKYRNGATAYLNFNGNYIITDRISFDWNIRYNSIADPQGRSKSTIKQLFALQTRWLQKRMTVGIMAIDPFKQQEYTTYTYGKNFTLTNDYLTRTRNLRLSLAYNLTKSPAAKAAENKARINKAVKEVKAAGKK